MVQPRTKVMRAALRRDGRPFAAICGEEMWEEARDESFSGGHARTDYASGDFDAAPDGCTDIIPYVILVSFRNLNSSS